MPKILLNSKVNNHELGQGVLLCERSPQIIQKRTAQIEIPTAVFSFSVGNT